MERAIATITRSLQESRRLLQGLQHCRSYIRYSRPGPQDQLGSDFDAPGHLDVAALEQLGVPRDADFYLCGPADVSA